MAQFLLLEFLLSFACSSASFQKLIDKVSFSLQVPDGSVVALVSKQVTAYNAVNNSTVSRTSASKYGKGLCADTD